MEISSLIHEYMESNRRITVAGFGTFLSLGSDLPLLFTEFLIEEDGVLRGLLQGRGATELESVAMVEAFVAQLQERLRLEGRCELAPLGVLVRDDQGGVTFEGSGERGGVIPMESRVVEERVIEEELSEAESEDPTRGGLDRVMKLVIFVVLVAIAGLIYVIYMEWMLGNVSFGEEVDTLIERVLNKAHSLLDML